MYEPVAHAFAQTPPTSTDRTLAVLTPLLGKFFGFLAPLVVYLVKKGEGDSLATQVARESLNFHITVLLACLVSLMLAFVLIGVVLLWAIGLAFVVLSLVAAVKASSGVTYRYPFTWRLIKG